MRDASAAVPRLRHSFLRSDLIPSAYGLSRCDSSPLLLDFVHSGLILPTHSSVHSGRVFQGKGKGVRQTLEDHTPTPELKRLFIWGVLWSSRVLKSLQVVRSNGS